MSRSEARVPYSPRLAPAAQLLLDIIADVARKRAARSAVQPVQVYQAQQPLDARVIAALDQHGAMQPRYLRAFLGVSAMSLSRSLARLSAQGRIEAAGRTKDRRYTRSDGARE